MRNRGSVCLLLSVILGACGDVTFEDRGQEIVVPDSKAASFELLTPQRRLPASARNVRANYRRFLDSVLWVRFDAPTPEARQFVEQLTGNPLRRGYDPWHGHPPDLEWWPREFPPQAEGSDQNFGLSDRLPPIRVMMVARGDTATVWLDTFGD